MDRIGAAAGIAFVVGALAGLVIHGYPEVGATGKKIVDWASATDPTRFGFGSWIEAIAYLLLLTFAARIWSILRRAEGGGGWLSALALGGALIHVGMILPINETYAAILKGGKEGVDPATLAFLRDVVRFIYERSFIALGVFFAGAAAVLLRTRALPRWVGWSSALLALGLLAPNPISVGTGYVSLLWVLAVSGYLVVRPETRDAAAVQFSTP
jgi:hypothetical protein